ncbi:hypothetical protein AMECASPLE_039852 [Ameca splendens]|uniref:Uncharacterized protein n=1 Tax=Ameca splendens TaxID=208324 RepID=A0ABV0ZHB4_9TELE
MQHIYWYQLLSNLMFSYRKRNELMESIKTYKPTVSSVSQARVLLIGQVGAGKSSFFNSINSVFRGHVTSQAISGSSSTSLTTQVCLCLSFIWFPVFHINKKLPIVIFWVNHFTFFSFEPTL